jgi:succinate dehydrogenase/fumarate reductase flavoprotein subunit
VYEEGTRLVTRGEVNPSMISPKQALLRLQKIMDEYVGGIGTHYMTNGVLLQRGLELLAMLKEDMNHMGAEDLHQLRQVRGNGGAGRHCSADGLDTADHHGVQILQFVNAVGLCTKVLW